ncbi:MAG: peptide deformylase [Coriobacteriia bacterium]|nr:peptide deformylase [Coriobacteriia bacterium]
MDIKGAVARLSSRRGCTDAHPLQVLSHPDSRLAQLSLPIDFDNEDASSIKQIVADLVAAMRAQNGVGLAAIQVGIPKRMFVYDDSETGTDARVLINPRIVQRSEELLQEEEGCLSFPGLYRPVARNSSVVVEAFDVDGNPTTVQAEGFLARVFQHEIDHLDGICFVEHLSDQDKKLALREYFALPVG